MGRLARLGDLKTKGLRTRVPLYNCDATLIVGAIDWRELSRWMGRKGVGEILRVWWMEGWGFKDM